MIIHWLENLIDPLSESDSTQPPATTWTFIFYYLKPLKKLLAFTLVITGIAAISELYIYVFLGQIVDRLNVAEPATFFDAYEINLMVMIAVVAVLRPLTTLLSRGVINLALAPGIANTVRWQNYRYVLRQSLFFFQEDFAGRIAQKVMQTGHALREAVVNVIDGLWLLIIYMVGISFLFIEINARLLLPLLFWSVAYCVVVVYMVPPVQKKSASLSEANSGLIGRIVDSYTNIQTVKLFSHASREEQFVAVGFIKQMKAFQSLMRSVLSMTGVLIFLNTLLIIGTAYISIRLWQRDLLTVGEIAVANGLIIRVNQMSGWILRTITSLFEQIGTVQNGIETISRPNIVVDKNAAKTLQVKQGEIEFCSVNFHYSRELPVIQDFSLAVNSGEKVGLVGRSGAGKSTLVNLLLRFYDLSSGSIRIDGQDIAGLSQESLREKIAMVSQDTALLHRSIRDNIQYGKSNASAEAIEQAARLAGADQFIPELIDSRGRRGYDALVGERGVKLSGGQRQRIAIARVILKNAPVLILDEATSALDTEVEFAIQQQLTHLTAGKTVIAIAHRLSTIAALDRLIVMDAGRIVEQGTHQQLVGSEGLYAQLWKRQSGGFLGLTTEENDLRD